MYLRNHLDISLRNNSQFKKKITLEVYSPKEIEYPNS